MQDSVADLQILIQIVNLDLGENINLNNNLCSDCNL